MRVGMISAVWLSAWVMWAGGNAAAMDRSTRNALRHAGEVLAVARMCDKLKVNEAALIIMVAGNGGDLTLADHSKVVEEQARSDIAAWKGKGAEGACLAGLALYGPTGSSIRGLVSLTRR